MVDNSNSLNNHIYTNNNNNNLYNNKNIEINYDKYSIPKNLNTNEIISNKGRNSSLNGGIRVNTPNSLSKMYSKCINNNNSNIMIKNNIYDNSLSKK